MTVCEVRVMENKGAIHVRHRRLLSADRLCDFEQVYLLPCPIWPWYISQPAICPVIYLSQWNSSARVCACVCGSVCVCLYAVVSGCSRSSWSCIIMVVSAARPLITAQGYQPLTLTLAPLFPPQHTHINTNNTNIAQVNKGDLVQGWWMLVLPHRIIIWAYLSCLLPIHTVCSPQIILNNQVKVDSGLHLSRVAI